MELIHSSQPYLYNYDNNEGLLYCFADEQLTLMFGGPVLIRPWKIRQRNLSTGADNPVPTNRFQPGYGKVVIECNPHIGILNNQLTLLYTAGFSNGRDTPIKYFYCAMDSVDYTFSNLSNFRVLHPTFTACIFGDSLLYVHKQINGDRLVSQPLVTSTRPTVISLEGMDLEEILRITKVFDQDKLIITGRMSNNIDRSYLVNKDLQIDKIINNQYNYDVYKCSICNNKLAYTVKLSANHQDEQRSIILENMA